MWDDSLAITMGSILGGTHERDGVCTPHENGGVSGKKNIVLNKLGSTKHSLFHIHQYPLRLVLKETELMIQFSSEREPAPSLGFRSVLST